MRNYIRDGQYGLYDLYIGWASAMTGVAPNRLLASLADRSPAFRPGRHDESAARRTRVAVSGRSGVSVDQDGQGGAEARHERAGWPLDPADLIFADDLLLHINRSYL